MARDRIELNNDDFAAAVPFGFVADRSGQLMLIGDALRRRLGARPGMLVQDVFKVLRPWRVASFLDLPVNPKGTVVLRAIDWDLELKGNTLAIDDGERIAFLGSAVVRDIDEFQQRGLLISDFPPSDATPDLLLSMQATRSALDDAHNLSTELKVALADARAAMDAKARFLAMMSHEIRTPLNGFGSMIDLMRDGSLGDEHRENLDTMDQCARSLLVLVNDILEFSKLEAKRVEVVPAPVAVRPAMTRIVDHFRAAAKERAIDLQLDIDIAGVQWLSFDIERVRQVTANLVGNAIKFTPCGSIHVRVTVPSPDLLSIDVSDSGIGISQHDRAHLFEPFVQADTSITRRFGGTGLGLSISRQLAMAMGGNVELVRSDESGTLFRFTLQAPVCDAPPEPAPASQQRPCDTTRFLGASVLVAEDNSTNQLIAKRLLQKLGIEPILVNNGLAAVESAQTRHFDLILMDLMMPTLGGIDATRLIRSHAGPCQHVPIIAFSAATFDTDREAAAQAGMSGFVDKPARLESLRAILADHLPLRANAAADGNAVPADRPPS